VAWCLVWVSGLYLRWNKFEKLKWNEIGDTAAGFASPLAFLWLVVGYYLQREELALQRKELKENRTVLSEQKEQMALQADAISANEQHARRDTFFRMLDFVRHEMAMRAAHLYANLRSASVVKFADAPDFLNNEMNRYLQGDHDLFFRVFPRQLAEIDRHARGMVARRTAASKGDETPSEAEIILHKMSENSEIVSSMQTLQILYENLVEAASKIDDGGALKYQLKDSSLGSCVEEISNRLANANG
jgi:hypothetical protein